MPHPNPEDITRTYTPLVKDTVVFHYRIVESIGAGGMGEVYLAEDTKLNRRVALKFLSSHMAANPDLRARFTREAQAVAKLDHPNIVTIYEVSEFNSRPFFSMQYIDGKTIHVFCQEEPLSIGKIANLIAQVADGLAKAHTVGVTHRDIKSANIIVDREFRAKILDFGLATIKGGETLTQAGSTLGTVAYMSPEQAQGRELDHRSDLFSLGIVMYELIAGRTPFKRGNDAATLHAITSDAPEPLTRYKNDIPPELQRIVSKILAKNPVERYQSAADLAADLRAMGRALDSGEHTSTGRVAASQPSIAVLPFANMSADPENEYFSDGLTEELLNMLAKIPELKVTGRTSSFAFKGKQEDLRAIGQKLGVGTLLEGSVRKAGNRVRITAQLVNVSDGFHLWSESYDRVLDDIFAVQDEIAGAVAKALHVTLFGRTAVSKPVDPESYALVLRARQAASRMDKSSLETAVALYRQAIEIDSTNARAWAGLSYVHGHRIAYGHADYQAEHMLARSAAEKALALDESLPEAHLAMGFVYGALDLQIKESLVEIRRAHELAPNNCAILTSMALCEMIFGNFERAIDLAKLAVKLDPLDPWVRRELGRIYTVAGRLEEAYEVMTKVIEMSPDMTTLRLGLGWIELLQGKLEEAEKSVAREIVAGYRYCGQAMVSHALGKKSDSDQQLVNLISEGENWAFQIALVYGYRGESDKAFEWLERGYEVRDSGIPLTKVHFCLVNLHADPRWPLFLKKIGLE